MMRRMRKRIVFACWLLAAAACTRDATEGGQATPRVEVRPVTVRTVAGTRTQLAGDGDGVLWSPGDRIGIFLESDGTFTALNTPLTFDGDTPSATGRFTGEAAFAADGGVHTLYAYYPYTEQTVPRVDSVSFFLQARQQQQAAGTSGHLGLSDFAVAQAATSSTGEFGPLLFEHSFAVVEMDLTASGELAGKSLASVTLYASDPSTTSIYGDPAGSVYMYGPLAFNLTTTEPHRGVWGGGQSRALYASLSFVEQPVLGSDPVRAYLTINAQDYSAGQGKIFLVAETADGYVSTVELPGINIEPGQMRVIERELTQATVPTSRVDLSAAGTANCYVANMPGQLYSFDATVAGNGVVTDDLAAAVLRYEGRTIPTALAGNDARLLWQSDPDLIVPGSVGYAGGRISFRTSGRPTALGGNAVIALYADASSDEVLWSWHIWVTDTSNEALLAAAQTYVLPAAYEAAYGAGSTQMMDRTLGALTTEQSAYTHSLSAMLYQWGRKDPFPAQNVVYTGEGQRLAYLLNWAPVPSTGSVGTTQGTGNTLYAITHPATFIYVAGTATSYDWYYGGGRGNTSEQRNNSLWGNPEGMTVGQTTVKTLFDPCPPGWKLPHGYAYTAFTQTGGSVNLPGSQAHLTGNFVQGWRLVYNGSDATYYPTVGSRNDELAFYSSTSAGFYWTSAAPGDTFGAQGFWMMSSQLAPLTTNPRAIGNPVRCMKEQS